MIQWWTCRRSILMSCSTTVGVVGVFRRLPDIFCHQKSTTLVHIGLGRSQFPPWHQAVNRAWHPSPQALTVDRSRVLPPSSLGDMLMKLQFREPGVGVGPPGALGTPALGCSPRKRTSQHEASGGFALLLTGFTSFLGFLSAGATRGSSVVGSGLGLLGRKGNSRA